MYGQNKPTWTIKKDIYYNLLSKLKKNIFKFNINTFYRNSG